MVAVLDWLRNTSSVLKVIDLNLITSTIRDYSRRCISADPAGCEDARGGFFLANKSSAWQDLGNYELILEENLGINDAGDFGFDNITLGVPGSGAPNIGHQIVVGIVAKDYYLATWGLRPAPTNFTNLDTPVSSLLQSLKATNKIPSLSWGYTAGSYQVSQGTSLRI